MRWLAVALILVLVCGGFLALGGYAGFEYWRVGQSLTAEAPVEDVAPVPEVAPPSTACADGIAAFDARDYDAATSRLDVCLEADPANVEARLRRGRAWAALGRYERADVDLVRGLADRPDAAEAWEALVFSRAQNGDDRGAITAAERWLAVDPTAARPLRLRADSRYRLGEYEAALTDAKDACAKGDAEGCVLEARMKDARKHR